MGDFKYCPAAAGNGADRQAAGVFSAGKDVPGAGAAGGMGAALMAFLGAELKNGQNYQKDAESAAVRS